MVLCYRYQNTEHNRDSERWDIMEKVFISYSRKDIDFARKLAGEMPSRHWIITTPSGFEAFFSRCADGFAKASPPDMRRIAEIFDEHGITLLEGERNG